MSGNVLNAPRINTLLETTEQNNKFFLGKIIT